MNLKNLFCFLKKISGFIFLLILSFVYLLITKLLNHLLKSRKILQNVETITKKIERGLFYLHFFRRCDFHSREFR